MDGEFTVTAFWDDEAKVWIATSEDVPGLATEAATMEALVDKLKIMIPELLDANGIALMTEQVPFSVSGTLHATAPRRAA